MALLILTFDFLLKGLKSLIVAILDLELCATRQPLRYLLPLVAEIFDFVVEKKILVVAPVLFLHLDLQKVFVSLSQLFDSIFCINL